MSEHDPSAGPIDRDGPDASDQRRRGIAAGSANARRDTEPRRHASPPAVRPTGGRA